MAYFGDREGSAHFLRSALLRWTMVLLAFVALLVPTSEAAKRRIARKKPAVATQAATAKPVAAKSAAVKKTAAKPVAKKPAVKKTAKRRTRRRSNPRWLTPTFVDYNGLGDDYEGEDPEVRAAAVAALGTHNGTVVVVDPTSGRILTAVNQGMAFTRGFQPCSSFKPVVGLGGLAEGIITRETMLKVARRQQMNLTDALATSNNAYFQAVGSKLGFDRVRAYATLFGIGERATINVEREQPGALTPVPPSIGVGYMSSHGEGIQFTAVQLAAMMTAIANGGTLYYLQYPRTPFEAATMEPRIKRQLAIGEWIPEIKPGMMGAIEFGTARRAAYSADEPILGKTGTCTDRNSPTHLGWFGSFNETTARKLVVVVLLTGSNGVGGSQASAVGGEVYRRLSEAKYFAANTAGDVITLAGN